LRALLSMLSPILPHTTEEALQVLQRRESEAEPSNDDEALRAAAQSTLAQRWPRDIESLTAEQADVDRWRLLINVRDSVNVALEKQVMFV
jgi:isoleucyl-tRNA synthetase